MESSIAFSRYTEEDLKRMSYYIEFKAPLIIHIKLGEVLKHLNADCQYKSLFVTNKSGG
jgi:hypothetical protein